MSILASCGSCIKFHSWPEGTYMGNFDPTDENLYLRNISWCSNGSKLVAVTSKGEPIIIEAPTHPKNIESPKLAINSLNITNANTATFSKVRPNSLTIGTLNGEVYVFDVGAGKILYEYPVLPQGVQFLEYGADDVVLAAGCRNGQIVLYTRRNNKILITASFFVHNSYSLSAMNCNCANQQLLAGASKEGAVSIWNYNTGNAVFVGKPHTNIVTDLAFSPSDRVISSVGLDRKFNTYDLRSNQLVFSNVLERELTSVAYSLYRDEMAVSTNDGQLLCYDKRNTTTPLCTFIAHKKPIKKIAFHTENLKLPEEEAHFFRSEPNHVSSYSASGDCSALIPDVKRLPGAMDQLNVKVSNWVENLPNSSSDTILNAADAAALPPEDVHEKNLEKLRNDLMKEMKTLTDKFSEYMNQQFFKIRMEVSKSFVTLEEQTERKSRSFMLALREAAKERKTPSHHMCTQLSKSKK